MSQVTYLHTTETKNEITGEVTSRKEEKKVKQPQEEDYVKIYIKHINYLNELPQGLEGVIYSILKRVGWDNEIIINSSVKRQIAQESGKSFNTINQYITKLCNYNILIRQDVGMYYLNPELYGKGKWGEILELRKKLNIKITYAQDKITIDTKLPK